MSSSSLTTQWVPNGQYLAYLTQLLQEASMAHDTGKQAQVSRAMEDFNTLPEADNYLLLVLVGASTIGAGATDDTIRGMAGLILKNNFRRREELPQSTLHFLKSYGANSTDGQGEGALLRALGDRQPLVRNTVGTLLASIVRRLGRKLSIFWPELLPALLALTLRGTSGDAAMSALGKICEDAGEELGRDPAHPLDTLIPALVSIARESPAETIRAAAVGALNNLLPVDHVMDDEKNVSEIIGLLSLLAGRERSPLLRKTICQSLNILQDYYSEQMTGILPSVLGYMFENLKGSTETPDLEGAQLEACEFWLSFVERDGAPALLRPMLPDLIRVLLTNMIYAKDDPDLEINELPDADVANGEIRAPMGNDIRPRHHKGTMHRIASGEKGEIVETGMSGLRESTAGRNDNDDDDDDDNNCNDDDDDEEEDNSNWTLRKCSAATLDVLASTMDAEEFVAQVLPLLSEKLASSSGDWRHQEAGILTLGAIAEGCQETLVPHLPAIIPYLIQALTATSSVPLVRVIAAWSLSRFAPSLDTACSTSLGTAVLHALLSTMSSGNRKVQHAAVTALGVLAEKAKSIVGGNLMPVMQAIRHGLIHYTTGRNLVVLYDVIGTLCEGLRDELTMSRDCLNLILPILLEHWQQQAMTPLMDDQRIFGLLECMCSLCIACSAQLSTALAGPIYRRSLLMTEAILRAASLDPEADVEFEYAVVALDLIGGLVQGMEERFAALAGDIRGEDGHGLVDLLTASAAMEDSADLRQSAFALVGDLAQKCPMPLAEFIRPDSPLIAAIDRYMDVMREDNTQGAANNAVWALGELFVRFPEKMVPVASHLNERLCAILAYADGTVSRGYLENVAVALGRGMALNPSAPPLFASHLGRWALMMSLVSDLQERSSAWTPVVRILLAAPEYIEIASIPPLLKSIFHFRSPPVELEMAFGSLVRILYNRMGGPSGWYNYRRAHLADVNAGFEARFGLSIQD